MERPRSSRPPGRPAALRAAEPRRAPGSPLTPGRLLTGLALIGSTLFVAWGLTARDATQIPTLCVGFLVYGIVFATLALRGASTTYRAAREDRAGQAFTFALLGGVAALISAGSFALAVVLALVLGAA